MSTNVTIKAESESGFIKVFVNDEFQNPQQVLDGPGTTSVSLNEGGTYDLTYFVKGILGQHYVIKILEPSQAIWTDRDTIDGDGKVAGQHRIRL